MSHAVIFHANEEARMTTKRRREVSLTTYLKYDLIGTWLLFRRSDTISDRDGLDRLWLPLLAGLLRLLLLQADEGDGDSGIREKSREQRLDSFL